MNKVCLSRWRKALDRKGFDWLTRETRGKSNVGGYYNAQICWKSQNVFLQDKFLDTPNTYSEAPNLSKWDAKQVFMAVFGWVVYKLFEEAAVAVLFRLIPIPRSIHTSLTIKSVANNAVLFLAVYWIITNCFVVTMYFLFSAVILVESSCV